MTAEAYWTSTNITSIGAAALAITGVALPFIRDVYRDWRAGRSTDSQSSVKLAETMAERADRIAREQYDRLEAERDHHAQALAASDQALVQSRREGRAMEDWAHWYRHGWMNMQQRFVSLLQLADRVLTGDMTPERGRANIDQMLRSLPDEPCSVPLLQDAAGEKPPR